MWSPTQADLTTKLTKRNVKGWTVNIANTGDMTSLLTEWLVKIYAKLKKDVDVTAAIMDGAIAFRYFIFFTYFTHKDNKEL